MDNSMTRIFFSLIRSAILNKPMSEEDRAEFFKTKPEALAELAKMHDISHLLALGLKINGLSQNAGRSVLVAVSRHEQLQYEFDALCETLEEAAIPFIPLKGSVTRYLYPEPWMRTSCDIDLLIKKDDLEKAIAHLVSSCEYEAGERETHDVSLYSPGGVHVELHFDLVEDGRANNAKKVLSAVWKNASLKENCSYHYVMSDEFFYFYHIAHMAKHFECGGCGVRPFIDLWILDTLPDAPASQRNDLLTAGGLMKFTETARELSRVWLENASHSELTLQMQEYILQGGSYGSSENRVALNQSKKGGRLGYLLSRMFIPYNKLKLYYPIIEKYKVLTPVMQIRRWFMLLDPNLARQAKEELRSNSTVNSAKANEMKAFLDNLGL